MTYLHVGRKKKAHDIVYINIYKTHGAPTCHSDTHYLRQMFVGAIRLIGRKHVTSSEKSARLLAAFEAADEDGSGCLDSRELRTAIAELHLVRVRLRLLLYSLRPESLSLPVGTIQVGIFRA